MSTPHGMKCAPRTLGTGDKVHIYSDPARIILQLRHQVPSEVNLLEPSFKVVVSLTPAEAQSEAYNATVAPTLAAASGHPGPPTHKKSRKVSKGRRNAPQRKQKRPPPH